jgi:hypothetical protein
VSYNTVCLLQKLVQVLDAEDRRLDRAPIEFEQHLVEYGRDVHVHGVAMSSGLAAMMMLAAGMPLRSSLTSE